MLLAQRQSSGHISMLTNMLNIYLITMETKTEKVYRIHLDNPKYRIGDKKAGGANIIALLKDHFESLAELHDFIDWASLSIEKDKNRPYVLVVKILCYDFNGEMNNAQ